MRQRAQRVAGTPQRAELTLYLSFSRPVMQIIPSDIVEFVQSHTQKTETLVGTQRLFG